jgi:hypothetical protein
MAQSAKQKSAFAAMIAGKKGKSAKQVDPTTPFPAPKTKGTAPTPKGKKPTLKIDIMLAKAMPGIGSNGKPVPKKDKSKSKKGK